MTKAELITFIEDMPIYANRIEGVEREKGSTGSLLGGVYGPIRTSADKLAYLKRIVADSAATAQGGDAPAKVVYVGDSATDYDCLREADLGIWVCGVKDGEEYRERFKEVFKPLEEEPVTLGNIDWETSKGRIAWAGDLDCVVRALERSKGNDGVGPLSGRGVGGVDGDVILDRSA